MEMMLRQHIEFSRLFYDVSNNAGKVDRNCELLGFIVIFWLAATSPTCVAKVTYILVLAKNILLLATGC